MTGPDEPPADEASVLSSLPGTRPHRRSPKRAAANPDGTVPSEPTPPTTRRARAPRARRPPVEPGPPDTLVDPVPAGSPVDTSARRPARDPATPPVATQGFEAEPIHGSVNPPTGSELLASVAQGATELVEIGLSLTRRVARSVFDRLPRL